MTPFVDVMLVLLIVFMVTAPLLTTGVTMNTIRRTSITPFVDVMLVLLIVFMVTAPLLTTGVTVDLPEAQSSALPGQDEPLAVTVAGDGRIFLQDSPIAIEELGPRLLAITRRNPEARIFVRGDRAVDYGRVMATVGAINQAGFTRVALVTEVPPRRAASASTGASLR